MSTPCDRYDAPEAVTVPEPEPGHAADPPADPLVRASLGALAEAREAGRQRDAAERAMKRHLSPQAMAVYRALVDAIDTERGMWMDVRVAELARHFPGLAPAIQLAWAHVIDRRIDAIGGCCAPGEAVGP